MTIKKKKREGGVCNDDKNVFTVGPIKLLMSAGNFFQTGVDGGSTFGGLTVIVDNPS